ncbi:hypothetical protein EK21DRAFT_92854 [Setomelanomma holmii]|uniref:Uncharacterized protein n=1 Tax=Setomelanomma holmii TaxID=210430 RepID=A0A9P4H392_9PLEO|nr:hypothetical protein EK21DRAFT_92854 [Setomelanomma holmii]
MLMSTLSCSHEETSQLIARCLNAVFESSSIVALTMATSMGTVPIQLQETVCELNASGVAANVPSVSNYRIIEVDYLTSSSVQGMQLAEPTQEDDRTVERQMAIGAKAPDIGVTLTHQPQQQFPTGPPAHRSRSKSLGNIAVMNKATTTSTYETSPQLKPWLQSSIDSRLRARPVPLSE